MDAKHHAWLARRLIEACGGLDQAASPRCRLAKSRLSECQVADSGAFMPADVIADLEAYCGEPIYSRVLFESRPGYVEASCLMTEAFETTELAAEFQRLCRLAAADGKLDAGERRQIADAIAAMEQQLREMRAAAERGPS